MKTQKTKPQITECFKVVITSDKKHWSTSYVWNNSGALQYSKNKWTKPKILNSKLFVFESLAKAQYFAAFNVSGKSTQVSVFTCLAKNVVQLSDISFNCDTPSIEAFWRHILPPAHIVRPPEGTYFADEVKIFGEPLEYC